MIELYDLKTRVNSERINENAPKFKYYLSLNKGDRIRVGWRFKKVLYKEFYAETDTLVIVVK
jgi:hypothetical protein